MTIVVGADSGREAILRAARKRFARLPYAAVTLRDIAADASVSASLIVKHFGGKESLFDAVADFTSAADALWDAPLADLGVHAVRTLVEHRRAHQSDLLVRVVFAAGGDDERSLLRQRFQEQIVSRLAERLSGPDRAVRAELAVAQLLGLGAAMAVNRDGPVATADLALVIDRYAPAIQALVDG